MTGHNLKVAFRVLWRDKFNTALNIIGLTIGIVCFVLLGLYVSQEMSYDRFHEKKDRIYRVWLYENYGDDRVFFNSVTPIRFESLFEENFPEVEKTVQYYMRNFPVSRDQDHILNEQVAIISPEFFTVFDFSFVAGDQTLPFGDRYQIILSENYAEKFFAGEEPLGKTLNLQFGDDFKAFKVGAIIENIPQNSGIQFDLAISSEHNRELFGERALSAWTSVSPETYVLIRDNASIRSVEASSQDVIMQYLADEVNRDEYTVGFQALTDIHLNPDIPAGIAPVSNPVYIYILGIIGLLVLTIACINYTTLSVGQSIKRAREVGLRKIMGAAKTSLVAQYLSESILLVFLSMGIGTLLAIVCIPTFNRLSGADLVYVFEWWHLIFFILIGLIIGILAGIYPALILTNTRIMQIMRAGNSAGGRHWVRKTLVTFQFVITVLLISSTLIMHRQLNYLQSKDLGYTYDAYISVPMFADQGPSSYFERVSSAQQNADILKARLEKRPEISGITEASHVFGTQGWAHLAFTDESGAFRWFTLLSVDAEFLRAFDIDVVQGRDFEKGNVLDKRQSIVINQAAVDFFGFENLSVKNYPVRSLVTIASSEWSKIFTSLRYIKPLNP